jgi:putative endonuclease
MNLGRKGEEIVSQNLELQNFKILHRNYRTPEGEVDLVASFAETLHIVEIKTRRNTNEALKGGRGVLNWEQRKRLEKAARWLWTQYRKEFKTFRCSLAIVTDCGIKWVNLSLLYDRA